MKRHRHPDPYGWVESEGRRTTVQEVRPPPDEREAPVEHVPAHLAQGRLMERPVDIGGRLGRRVIPTFHAGAPR